MGKVVVFGLKDFASLAHFYLKHDTTHDVVAFCVTKEHLPDPPHFEGLPVVPFEDVEHVYAPSDFLFFAPMSHRSMNSVREGVYRMIKAKGYRMISYVSSRATVFPGADIGDNCFILEDNTIQPLTRIGNNVMMWSGNHIGHHGLIKDHVLFTSHVVLSGHCVVEPYCVFGVNSTIRDFTHLAEGTFIAMGACVTHDTEPWGVYKGVPARKGDKLSNESDL